LLPGEERDEVDDLLAEARDLLYARLLEYRAFRELSDHLALRLAGNQPYVARDVPLESRFRRLVPETPLAVDAVGLARLAASALTPPPVEVVDLAHVRRSTHSVRDAATALLDRLRHGGGGAFSELTQGHERDERVVWFLAALELFKLGHLELDQPDLRGPLHVTPTSGGRDLRSLTEADLTSADPVDAVEHAPTDAGPSAHDVED
jgi:segregation and condensation protein A